MRIKVINPNTTAGMTAKIGEAARAIAAPGTEIVAVNPAFGPVSIESHYDEAVSVLGVLEEVRKGEEEGCDGYIIACFGDPGLLAAREIATGPVVGIAEAAMHAASFISTGFSVVTTLNRTCIIAEHLVERYGMHHACRKVRGTDIPVLDLEETGNAALHTILAECRRAAEEDRCGAIVLGCAGMADLVATVQREIGMPVIDGVAAAVVQVEGLVRLGLGTSKHGDLAWPLPKPYTGSLSHFAVKDRRTRS
jgi:allantoin racemase